MRLAAQSKSEAAEAKRASGKEWEGELEAKSAGGNEWESDFFFTAAIHCCERVLALLKTSTSETTIAAWVPFMEYCHQNGPLPVKIDAYSVTYGPGFFMFWMLAQHFLSIS